MRGLVPRQHPFGWSVVSVQDGPAVSMRCYPRNRVLGGRELTWTGWLSASVIEGQVGVKQQTNKCLRHLHPADLTVTSGVSSKLLPLKLLLYYTTLGIQEAETSDHQECGF